MGWVGLSACTTLSPCEQDLIDHKYVVRGAGVSAEKLAKEECNRGTPDEIKLAKLLVDRKYETDFGRALSDTQGQKRKNIDCAIKEYDAHKKTSHAPFGIPEPCRN
jgi:hypothetical protein